MAGQASVLAQRSSASFPDPPLHNKKRRCAVQPARRRFAYFAWHNPPPSSFRARRPRGSGLSSAARLSFFPAACGPVVQCSPTHQIRLRLAPTKLYRSQHMHPTGRPTCNEEAGRPCRAQGPLAPHMCTGIHRENICQVPWTGRCQPAYSETPASLPVSFESRCQEEGTFSFSFACFFPLHARGWASGTRIMEPRATDHGPTWALSGSLFPACVLAGWLFPSVAGWLPCGGGIARLLARLHTPSPAGYYPDPAALWGCCCEETLLATSLPSIQRE
ncbi:hypothetical protein BT67DRAFT_108951 [Trichocladium antarcticum]|uniref:Uncharacterized protein n=1 Tax=Trichocladium antarcticum TaxID=1450529 RepID=A0AAN6UQN4_9PEZI|nr:hypothetical protein BT67DRAFT_108951 [Trichocladium antarcticum]